MTTEKVVEHVAGEIRVLLDVGSFPLSEIAILYTTRGGEGGGALGVPELVAAALDRRGVLSGLRN